MVGPATNKLLHNMVSLKKLGEKSYDKLVDTLSKHFKLTPSEIVKCCKFHNRFRKPGKLVTTFLLNCFVYLSSATHSRSSFTIVLCAVLMTTPPKNGCLQN